MLSENVGLCFLFRKNSCNDWNDLRGL